VQHQHDGEEMMTFDHRVVSLGMMTDPNSIAATLDATAADDWELCGVTFLPNFGTYCYFKRQR
jgi:hypothetical protein